MSAAMIPAENLPVVRDCLMLAFSRASIDHNRGAGRAYRQALHAVGFGGVRPVVIDLDAHGWALLTALEARVSVEHDVMEQAKEPERTDAHRRMVGAETAMSQLGLGEPIAPPSRLDGRLRVIAGRRRLRR